MENEILIQILQVEHFFSITYLLYFNPTFEMGSVYCFRFSLHYLSTMSIGDISM